MLPPKPPPKGQFQARLAVYCSMFSFESLKDQLLKLMKLDTLLDSLSGYIEARVNLLKHEIKEEITGHISRVVIILLAAFLGLMALGFISITIALWLNEATASPYYGFLIVSGFYVLTALLLWGYRGVAAAMLQKKLRDKTGPDA